MCKFFFQISPKFASDGPIDNENIIRSYNGLEPWQDRRQAIIWTNDGPNLLTHICVVCPLSIIALNNTPIKFVLSCKKYAKMERSSGWLPWSSLKTLKANFDVPSYDQGSHPDDLPVFFCAWNLAGTETVRPHWCSIHWFHMMTSSNGNIFRVTGPLCGEFTGHRWIPRTKASDAELWCLTAPEWTVE